MLNSGKKNCALRDKKNKYSNYCDVCDATSSNISAISWRPVLVMEEANSSTWRGPPTMGK
jgi:hypothetical protein